ncbi:unnamed protein product [Rhizophagus irregularis]|nr:unnamed protein product [Rhizophagus irregularis]
MFIQNNNKIIKEAVTATLEVIGPVSDIFLITNIIPSDIFIQIRNAYAVIDLNLSISSDFSNYPAALRQELNVSVHYKRFLTKLVNKLDAYLLALEDNLMPYPSAQLPIVKLAEKY